MKTVLLSAFAVLAAGVLPSRGEDVKYLENSRYRVGVDLERGGTLCSFVDKHDASLGELISYAEPTFRGNGYTAVIDRTTASSSTYKPTDLTLVVNNSTVTKAEDGTSLDARMYLKYALHDDYLSVLVAFSNKTDQTNLPNDHELPALYVPGTLSRFSYFSSTTSWSSSTSSKTVTSISSPPFWGNAGEDARRTFTSSKEHWAAWTDPKLDRGIGVYTPKAEKVLFGQTQDKALSYVAPLATFAVAAATRYEYRYYLTSGTIDRMRDVFASVAFGTADGGYLGSGKVRISSAAGELGISAFDPAAGKLDFQGKFVSINGSRTSEDFALVCRTDLTDASTEMLLPATLSVAKYGRADIAELQMTLDDPPPSLFVMGVAERPSSYRAQMVEKGFPGDYADIMSALHERHPKWEFEPLFVSDMTWDAVLDKEMVPSRNLVAHSTWAPSPWNTLGLANYTPYYAENAQAYDSGSFYQASRAAVAYFMDPRNFLNDTEIFMFETLAYNEASQTQEAIEKALSGSFMANACHDGGTEKFSTLILSVGRELDVSPVFLAGRLKSEQGNGTVQAQGKIGDSLWELYADADGKVGGSNVWGTKYTKDNQATADVIAKGKNYYNGYCNLFNMGASGTGLFEIRYNAWKEAYEAPAKYHGPWTSQEKALYGGSVKVKERYIDTHRHTSYLQKFSVLAEAGTSRWSQYMQNIAAPLTESRSTKEAYVASRAYEDAHVFLVPVYLNMPSAPCPDPANGNSVYSPTK